MKRYNRIALELSLIVFALGISSVVLLQGAKATTGDFAKWSQVSHYSWFTQRWDLNARLSVDYNNDASSIISETHDGWVWTQSGSGWSTYGYKLVFSEGSTSGGWKKVETHVYLSHYKYGVYYAVCMVQIGTVYSYTWSASATLQSGKGVGSTIYTHVYDW